jgi:hypothetical protein
MVFGREITKYQLKNDSSGFLVGDTQMLDSMPSHVFNSVEFNNYEVFSQRRRNEDDISLEVPNGYERHPNNYYQMWFNRDIYN